ncbi:unnamed protein product [Mycena citricolor]|uniref:Diacylglycerol O-acyltransferase n=1 Tax=Mycena citricolor TaxID=2018698 RepID=A0AAD2HKU7_9AGAR|nr:unnamed protein product [Mycena citricolor]
MGVGSVMLYHWIKPSLDRDWVPWTDRLLIGMRDPMIPAVLELGGNLSLDRARELVCSRLIASVPRMSDRLVVPTSGAPYWERCARMDVTMHVREHKVDGAGYAQLRSVIEALGRAPVDFSRPPWDVSVIHLGDLETVVFVRVHHAITDGRGVSDLLMRCADQSRPPRERIAPHARASTLASLLDLRHLSRPPERTSAIKRREPLSEAAVAWTRRPFRIDDLKASAGRLGGGTINDILLAAVSGALQKYLSAGSHHISCKLPVDVFSPTDLSPDVVLGVHLSDLNVPLPVDEPDAFARFARVRETMRQAKSGYRTGLTAMASRLVGGLPARMRLGMIAADAQTVSCYVSNMRGPAIPLTIGGVPVDTVRCHPLGLNNIGVGVAVYSYNGALNVAVCTDKALIPDPDALCEHLEDQLEHLAKLDVTGVRFLGQSPMFCASHSIELAFPIQAVAPILLPADAGAISRFLVGTREPSLELGTDFTHHGADWVASFDLGVVGSLPRISQLETGTGLQRDCFTVVDRVPVAFGLVQQTVTVKSWQILDPGHHRSAYEIAVQGAGVRVWKSRQLEDLGPGKTRVVERMWGVCPWILKGVVAKDSVASLRKSMERYPDMVAKYNP